jgi:hypothetical protein
MNYGGNINSGSNLATDKEPLSQSKLDRLFGRIPDVEMMKMVKAQKGEGAKRLKELRIEKRILNKELYPRNLSPKRNGYLSMG